MRELTVLAVMFVFFVLPILSTSVIVALYGIKHELKRIADALERRK
jgi:hypothetical protein